MKPHHITVLSVTLLCAVIAQANSLSADNPFDQFTRDWRDDPVWHDGKAEVAVYDATRTIYGVQRTYQARLYTNKEHADPNTKTKDPTGKGRAVFKHHLRQDVPTENYTYHYSTMCYVGVDDLKSLKLDMSSQEDCGATFKQFVNHAGVCQWHQFSYFPNEGHISGSYHTPKNFAMHDALSLILRGYPFQNPPRALKLALLRDQTTTKHSPGGFGNGIAIVEMVGMESLDLPIGKVDSYHLKLTLAPTGSEHYWFAADASAPWLHVMVQYEGPGGTTYKLRSLERRAYWKR